MILIDANVFMYAAGTEHPNKAPSWRLLMQVAHGSVDGLIDAEVLQEILHRYRAIRRWQDGVQVFDLARRVVPAVVPVGIEIVERARDLMDRYEALAARDAIHAAAALHVGASAICSFDRDFDQITEIPRLDPSVP